MDKSRMSQAYCMCKECFLKAIAYFIQVDGLTNCEQ